MKILFSTDAYFTHNNGTSVSAQRYIEVLRERGHEVRILTNCDEKEIPNDIYALRTMPVPGFNHILEANGFSYAWPDKNIIREAVRWADVVHTMMPFPMEYITTKICIEEHKPMTSAFHVQMENITSNLGVGKWKWLNSFLYHMAYRHFYNKHNFIHCPSQFMADELRRYGYRNDIRPISNGIGEQFRFQRPPVKGQFGDKFVVLMVGRLAHEKRQDLIIKAVKHSKYANDIQLVFAGNGPLKRKYQQLSKGLPVPPVFGYYSQQELIRLMGQCHLYIHASDMESEAIGCIEAFATGIVPIIANSPLSATPQFALDDRCLFHAGDADDLCRRIDYWYEHQQELPALEKRYAESAKQYQLSKSVTQFEKMLHDAIAYYG